MIDVSFEEIIEKMARRSFDFWAKNKGREVVFEDMPDYERQFALDLATDQLACVLEVLWGEKL